MLFFWKDTEILPSFFEANTQKQKPLETFPGASF